jgi:hypothetical protein
MKYSYVIVLSVCVLFCTVCSCSTGEAATQVLGASSEAPVFLSCRAVTEKEIDFQFSLPVKVVSLHFSPAVEIAEVEEGSTVRVILSKSPGLGEKLTADLLAEDDYGNTINVLVPLRSRNDQMPDMLINEMRTEGSKAKPEYLEFKIRTSGNLGALRVFMAGNYKNPLVYEFAPAEVAQGEYVVLHLRTSDDEACKDELGADLNESGGAEAVAGGRDFWIPGSTKLLHKTDAVYVLDQDDRVIDAVMLSEEPGSWWNKEYFAEAADFLFKQGAWKSAAGKISGPSDAADTSAVKTATTRSISRDENAADTNTAADWFVTGTGGQTPGKLNKPKS